MGVREHSKKITHLFSADDTMVFCESDKRVMPNLMCVLMDFQVVSSLSINLSKSKIVKLGDESDTDSLSRVMGCKAISCRLSIWDYRWSQTLKRLGHEILWWLVLKRC